MSSDMVDKKNKAAITQQEKPKGEPAVQEPPEREPEMVDEPPKKLDTKYKLVNNIANTLEKVNPAVYNDTTIEGRSAKAIAALLSGVEVYGTMRSSQEMFDMMGGGPSVNNRMQGFAQFDTKFHRKKINTPRKYVDFFTKTIKGQVPFPNGRQKFDAVKDLAEQVSNGTIKGGEDLIRWTKSRKFGGSNWEGIDKGWGRVPGLADSLVDYIREDSSK